MNETTRVQHTPGPWTVEKDVRAGGVIHLAVTNRSAGNDWMPCSVTRMDLARDIDYANAALIAAAPDLLAACKAAEKAIDDASAARGRMTGAEGRALESLRAAIAKAEASR